MKTTTFFAILTSVLFLISCGGSSSGSSSCTKLLAPSKDKIYFGAFADFGGSEDEVSTQRVKDFETIAGKKIAWAYFSNNWYKGLTYPQAQIHAIHDAGSVPFVRLMPRSNDTQGRPEAHFTLQNIISRSHRPRWERTQEAY